MRRSHPTVRWIDKELRENLARASRDGRRAARTEPRASTAVYRTKEHALRIELTNGTAVTLPVRLIPSLRRAAPRDIRAVEILGQGGGLQQSARDDDAID